MQRQTAFRHLLLTCVVVPVLAACSSGGASSGTDCSPSPAIHSSPPRYATAGHTYRYVTDASWVCLIALCNSVDLHRGPTGATVDDLYDTVDWTPKESQVNKSFDFEIKTERDSCGDRAKQKWEVKVLPKPRIEAFSSNRIEIYPGESVNIRPVFSRGTGHIDGYGKVESGKQITLSNIGASSAYTLVVTNQAGTKISETINVEVLQPLRLERFEFSKNLITKGETTSLQWKVSGDLTTLIIDPLGPNLTASGSLGVSPGESTTYTLTATNALGDSVSASIHLEVLAKPAIASFTATPESAMLHESVLIEASFDGGNAAVQRVLESSDEMLIESDFDISVDSGPLTRNQRFRLVVTNEAGVTATQMISVPISGPGTFQWVDGEPGGSDGRFGGRAIKLLNGKTFLAGGSSLTELFDPATEIYSEGPRMPNGITYWPGMTNMADGRVLIAGGSGYWIYSWGSKKWLGSKPWVWIYDPVANTLVETTRLPNHAENVTKALLLPDGRILLYHRKPTSEIDRGEGILLFDPLTETYTSGAPINSGTRDPHIHLLDDGRVLFLENQANEPSKIYDPVSDTFELIGAMSVARENIISAKLHDGGILIAGGGSNSAEIFDPITQTFRLLDSPFDAGHTAVTLSDGRVLIAGRYRSEIFDPTTETFTQTGGALEYLSDTTLTLLEDGRVLKFGGFNRDHEIYTP